MKRIALYYPWIYLQSGIEKTILELTNRSGHSWTIFTSHFAPDSTYPGFSSKKVIELSRVPVGRSYPEVALAAIKISLQKIDLAAFDAFWVHSEGLGDLITLRNHSKPVICFCHTPLKIINDPFMRQAYLQQNKWKKPALALFSRLFNVLDKKAWKYYRHIFCVSNEVKNRILKADLTDVNRIELIYRGVDTHIIQPNWIFKPYFFHPARIKWWKNIELSIGAFKSFQNNYPELNNFKLIIAGQVDKGSRRYYRKLVSLSAGLKNIRIIPNPNEEEFANLYKYCYAVLSTTLNEDWGIIIIEAMAYGKPVISVNQGGPCESIVEGKTGFLVAPTPEAFAQKMAQLAQDMNLSLTLGKEARNRSLKYDWQNFVNRVDEYLDSL